MYHIYRICITCIGYVLHVQNIRLLGRLAPMFYFNCEKYHTKCEPNQKFIGYKHTDTPTDKVLIELGLEVLCAHLLFQLLILALFVSIFFLYLFVHYKTFSFEHP